MLEAVLGEKCIMMQFLRIEKHGKAGNSRTQTKTEMDTGVEKCRRISFESTNLIGSPQDDGEFKSPKMLSPLFA
jgi:hypothetical protein